ncbi:unnamed protein product [Prunus armeniaca]
MMGFGCVYKVFWVLGFFIISVPILGVLVKLPYIYCVFWSKIFIAFFIFLGKRYLSRLTSIYRRKYL